jgi:intein/homing endonuclease
MRIEAITTAAPEPVFNLHTTGPHNFIAEGVLAHNFTKLRWLRTWGH